MFLQRFVGSVPKSVFRPLPLAVLMTVLGGQALAGEATTPDVAPPALALYGVIQKDEGSRFLGGESQRRARWYKVGDQIEGFEVREISAESVLVTKQGVDFTLSFPLLSNPPVSQSEQAQAREATEREDRRAFVEELSQSIRGRFRPPDLRDRVVGSSGGVFLCAAAGYVRLSEMSGPWDCGK